MSQEEVQKSIPEVVGAQVATEDVKLTAGALDLQVLALSTYDLQSVVKRYFKALHTIALVECELCEDTKIECEHNLARRVLELDF